MSTRKKERYPRVRAIAALGRGDHLLTRMEAVTRKWVDVWFDGYDQVLSDSKDALSSGTVPLSQWMSTSSALTLKAVGVTIDSYATLMGSEPESTIDFTFDSAAQSTDPVYFEVPKGFDTLFSKGPLVGPKKKIEPEQIVVQSETSDDTIWSIKLTNLSDPVRGPAVAAAAPAAAAPAAAPAVVVAPIAAPPPAGPPPGGSPRARTSPSGNSFEVGDYVGTVVFTNKAGDKTTFQVTATRI
jgi:hypothetical protein